MKDVDLNLKTSFVKLNVKTIHGVRNVHILKRELKQKYIGNEKSSEINLRRLAASLATQFVHTITTLRII
jgi:hypothetical protein